ncbi:hypothetical protein ES707_09781 [subsurface metagenome]
MELTPPETDFVIIAQGKTYPIKDELKSLGFKWNKHNKVWYCLSDYTPAEGDFLIELKKCPPTMGICFRAFELKDNVWRETS